MSKISRRNFIKGAGVAALAVAAAGMLAGWGSSAPEMVGVNVGFVTAGLMHAARGEHEQTEDENKTC